MAKYNLIFVSGKLNQYTLQSEKITVLIETSSKPEVAILMDFEEVYPNIIGDAFQIMKHKDEIFNEYRTKSNLVEYKIEDMHKYLKQ